MTYLVSGGALNSIHSLLIKQRDQRQLLPQQAYNVLCAIKSDVTLHAVAAH